MDVLSIEDSYFITKLVLKIRECDLNSTKAGCVACMSGQWRSPETEKRKRNADER
jgi:hypothetical protein